MAALLPSPSSSSFPATQRAALWNCAAYLV
jgi:hypothetical protein